jgi:hypothetical protein
MPHEERPFFQTEASPLADAVPLRPDPLPTSAEDFGNVPHPSAGFGSVPQGSASFGTVPKPAAPFGSFPHVAEAELPPSGRERYTLTVREAARLFEMSGVARSERSIVNWCQRNRQGVARLEAYFDPNDRRYFITRQSVDTVISEERARAAKANAEPLPQPSEPLRNAEPDSDIVHRSTPNPNPARPGSSGSGRISADRDVPEDLLKENADLKITNRAKDYFIDQLKSERDALLQQLVSKSHKVGELESELRLLERPGGQG